MADVTTLGLAVDSSGVRKATDDLNKLPIAGEKAAASTRDLEKAMAAASTQGTVLGKIIGDTITGAGRLAASFFELALSAGDYRDIADQIGSKDAAGFASLQTAADITGVSMQKLATDSVALSTRLSKVDDDSRGAGKALDAIGLSVQQIKDLAPDEQFRTIAKALDGYADSSSKAAVSQALFRDPEALKFLKELGSETEKNTFLTEAQITTADDFGDASKRSRSEITQLIRAMGTDALPSISAFLGAIKETATEMAGLSTESKTLGANTGVSDFAESAARGFAFIVDAGDGVVRTIQVIGKSVGYLAAVQRAVLTGQVQEISSIVDSYKSDIDAVLDKQLFSEKVDQQFAAIKARGAAGAAKASDSRPDLDFDAQATKVHKVRDEYTSLIKRITEKTAADQAELDSVEKLLPAQEEAAKVNADIASGLLKLTPTQLANVQAALAAQLAVEKLNQAKQEEIKWQKQATDENASYVEGLMKQRDALDDKRKSAEQDLADYGLTAEALAKVESARLRDAAAALQQKAVQADSAYLDENARLYREQADELSRTADARDRLAGKQAQEHNDPLTGAQKGIEDYLDNVKRAGDATKQAVTSAVSGLEDITVSVLTGHGGKDAAKQWVDGIISEIVRLAVVKPLLASIFGGAGGGSGGGFLGAIAGAIGQFLGGSTSGGGTGGYVSGGSGSSSTVGMSLAVGTNYVPRDGMVATLHEGEAVVPKAFNPAAGGIAPGSSKPITLIVNNNGAPAKATQTQQETSQGTIITLMLDAVAQDVSSGGKVHDSMQKRFSLNPGGSTPRR